MTTKRFLLLTVTLVALFAIAAAPRSPAVVTLTPEGVSIGGTSFSEGSQVSAVTAVLGKPSRTDGGTIPTRLVYDDFGLEVRCSGQGTVQGFVFYFATPPDRPGTPKSHYTGKVQIGSAVVEASTQLDDAGRLVLQQGGKHISRLAFGVWNLHYGGSTVSFEQLDAKTIQTLWVDFQRGRQK